MPFWKFFVTTKPEVDDNDLPLSKYRIFDDDGNVKDAVAAPCVVVTSAIANAKASAKKSHAMSPKTRAKILRSIGVKPTSPRRGKNPVDSASTTVEDKVVENGEKSEESKPAVSPSRKSVSPPRRGSTARQSPTRKSSGSSRRSVSPPRTPKRDASRSPAKPERTPSPRKSTTPKRKSTSPKRASASPKSSSVSPAKRGNSRSPASRKPSSPKKSVSPRKSVSKRARSQSPQSGTPSSKWTVNALKVYAKGNNISITNERTKSEILAIIEKSNAKNN